MPRLVQLYIRSVAIGVGLAAAFTGLLIWFDVAHVGHLVTTSPQGWIAVAMLVVFNTVIFGGVQFAIAIMRLAEPEDHGGGKAARIGALGPQPLAQPVPVRKDRQLR